MRCALFTVLIAACTSPPEAPVREMATVTYTGDQLAVHVHFTNGNEDPVVVDGAHVTATFRGAPSELTYADQAYSGTITVTPALMADEAVVLTLDSPVETDVSTITAPAPIALDPLAASMSRSQDFTLTWSPATAEGMVWLIQSPCASGGGLVAAGADSALVKAGTITAPAGGTCAVDLQVLRARVTTPAPPIQYGELQFRTAAVASFSSTP